MSAATLDRAEASTGVVVAYCRISKDGDGRGLGVDRQREDCVRLAAMLGITLLPENVVIENDVGASVHTGKPRPLWDDVVRRAQAGEISHVLAYSLSRLTRQMIEREQLLDLRRFGVTITTTQGQRIYPTMSATEVQMIRMVGVNDTAESDILSERIRRSFVQNAANGTPHGPIAYGWDRHRERSGVVVDTLNEEQAAVIREAARRILAGDSLRGIARDLTERGVPAPRGGAWSTTILSKILLRERNAARRVHQGVVVGPAAWQPVLDDDTFDSLVALLRDPVRAPGRKANRHLLSGLIVCSKCHEQRVWIAFAASSTNGAPAYACKACHGLRRKQDTLDAYVVEAVCARLARQDALDWLAQDQDALAAARGHLAGLQARSDSLADGLAAGVLSVEQVTRANATLQPEIAAAHRAVELARPLPTAVRSLAELGDVELVREAWQLLTFDAQRAVIAELVTITLLPTLRRKFDPDGVRLDWRAA